jgi:hypothetical protein
VYRVSSQYRAAMSRSRQMVTRAIVRKAGKTLYGGRSLPVLDGFITVDGSADVRRTLDMTVAPLLYDSPLSAEPAFPYQETATTPLGTAGQEVHIMRGLVYPRGGIEWVPLGVFRIDDVAGDLVGSAPVRVTGPDRAAWVIDDRLLAPRTVSGPSAVSIIQQLIAESIGDAEVAVLTSADRRVGPTVIERDRWKDGVRALADSIGCVVYADQAGRFVIADAPRLTDEPVWRLHPGPDGVVVGVDTRRSRSDVWNAVAVTGDTPEGATEPVSAFVVDDFPGSPTAYGDPSKGYYGRRPQFMAIPSLTTRAQCVNAALARLARVTGAGKVVSVQSAPLYPLDADDVIDITADHRRGVLTTDRHIVDTIRVPLTATSGPFTLTTRGIGTLEEAS